MGISRQSHIPLYIQVKEDIKKNIVAEKFAPGDTIPSEKDLMDAYKVGRATIREAITQLVTEGFVEKRQGVGTFVKGQGKSVAFEPFISLEYTMRSFGLSMENKILRRELVRNTPDITQASSISAEQVFLLERSRLIENDVVALEEFTFPGAFYERIKDFDFSKSIGKLITNDLELEIKKFIQEVEIGDPSPEVIQALKLDQNEQILTMKRLLYLKDHTEPFQFYKLTVPLRLTSFPFA